MPRRQTGITSYTTSDGRKQWQYVLDHGVDAITGKRRQRRVRGFATSADATKALAEAKRTIEEGTFVEPSKLTLDAYLLSWADTRAVTGLAPKTASSYRQIVRDYVIPHIGHVPLQKLTAIALDDLYVLLLEEGGKRQQGLSRRTVRYTHTIINCALESAERKGLVTRNVARFADPPSAKSSKPPEPKVWTPAELRTFLDSTADHRFAMLFHLAALTGMRRGELCGLEWESVDLDAAELRVRQALTLVDGKPVFGPPKSRQSRRTISLDPGTVELLRKHRRRQKEARLAAGADWLDTGLVFTGPVGQQLHPDNVSFDFVGAVETLDGAVPTLSIHGLRHTHATHLLASGANPKIVSERLGHHSVAFTLDTYAHVMPGQQADAAAAVAALLKQSV